MTPVSSFETAVRNDNTDGDGTRTLTVKTFTGDRVDPGRGPGAGRMPAFLGLARHAGGVYVENEQRGMTIDEALAKAGLDFTVGLTDWQALDGDQTIPGAAKLRATVGTWTDGSKRVLGVAGKGYTPVQPREAGGFGQAVLDEAGATVAACAAYGDPIGSRMYLALQLPEGLMIGGQDPYDLYLTIGNSFNRETGLWGCIAPIRTQCTNQSTGIFHGARHRFAIRHTGGMEGRLADVRYTLDLTGTFSESFAAASEAMLATPMGAGEARQFVDKLMPTPVDVRTERGAHAWDDKRRQVTNMILDGALNNFGKGTRYAALQGVTEWADHVKEAKTVTGRYMRLVDPSETEELKSNAARLLLAGI